MQTVRDIMQTQVITVPRGISVREVVQVMASREVSGVPVVDENGSVLGVISATDVVRLAAQEAEIAVESQLLEPEPTPEGEKEAWPRSYFVYPEISPLLAVPQIQRLTGSGFDELTAEEIMTPAAYSVSPDVTIPEVARFLVRSRIHRALVVENGRLVGIVSSFDVLRVVAGIPEGGVDAESSA